MATIKIGDLEQNDELDQQAMSQVFGGRADNRLTPAPHSQLRQRESPFAAALSSPHQTGWQPTG